MKFDKGCGSRMKFPEPLLTVGDEFQFIGSCTVSHAYTWKNDVLIPVIDGDWCEDSTHRFQKVQTFYSKNRISLYNLLAGIVCFFYTQTWDLYLPFFSCGIY